MKPLESFAIEQFRGVKNLELNGLGRINVLFGLNNCGKTTVLEALSCYADPLDGLNWLSVGLKRFGLSPATSRVQALRWIFPQHSDSSPKNLYEGGKVALTSSGSYEVIRCDASFSEVMGILPEDRKVVSTDPDHLDVISEEREGVSQRRGARLQMDITKQTGDAERRQLTFWDERSVVR